MGLSPKLKWRVRKSNSAGDICILSLFYNFDQKKSKLIPFSQLTPHTPTHLHITHHPSSFTHYPFRISRTEIEWATEQVWEIVIRDRLPPMFAVHHHRLHLRPQLTVRFAAINFLRYYCISSLFYSFFVGIFPPSLTPLSPLKPVISNIGKLFYICVFFFQP